MDEPGFRRTLKRTGKKEHVVDGLVSQVRSFERYLVGERSKELESAGPEDVQNYVATLDQKDVKERMRGLALYYRFAGNESLARLASDIREQRIATTRKAFKLREFRGVNPADAGKLEAMGIITVEDMLTAGKTPEARRQLAEQAGITPEAILELVKLSDLSRLGAIKAVRARLYYDAGLDTPARFTHWEPDALRQMLVDFVERAGFDGIAPLPKEIRNAIDVARSLPVMVEYD